MDPPPAGQPPALVSIPVRCTVCPGCLPPAAVCLGRSPNRCVATACIRRTCVRVQVMAMLNTLYTRYDAMLDKYGVYKVSPNSEEAVASANPRFAAAYLSLPQA